MDPGLGSVGAESAFPSTLTAQSIHGTAAFLGGAGSPDRGDRTTAVGTLEHIEVDVRMFQFQGCT